jgi:hypothetical protein
LKHFSKPAFACLVLSSLAFWRAQVLFSSGAMSAPATDFQFRDLSRLLTSEPRAPGLWPSSPITELDALLLLISASLLLALLSAAFALLAHRRREPSASYAGTFVLALSVVVFAARLCGWVWPSYMAA